MCSLQHSCTVATVKFFFKSQFNSLHLMCRLPLCPAVHVSQGGACWQPCDEALAATLLMIVAALAFGYLLPVEPGMLHLRGQLGLAGCR